MEVDWVIIDIEELEPRIVPEDPGIVYLEPPHTRGR